MPIIPRCPVLVGAAEQKLSDYQQPITSSYQHHSKFTMHAVLTTPCVGAYRFSESSQQVQAASELPLQWVHLLLWHPERV